MGVGGTVLNSLLVFTTALGFADFRGEACMLGLISWFYLLCAGTLMRLELNETAALMPLEQEGTIRAR